MACVVLGGGGPQHATPISIEELYDGLAGIGFKYGPVFQGLRGAWRRGVEIFPEVTLQEASARGLVLLVCTQHYSTARFTR